jgi:hypothetical protein
MDASVLDSMQKFNAGLGYLKYKELQPVGKLFNFAYRDRAVQEAGRKWPEFLPPCAPGWRAGAIVLSRSRSRPCGAAARRIAEGRKGQQHIDAGAFGYHISRGARPHRTARCHSGNSRTHIG